MHRDLAELKGDHASFVSLIYQARKRKSRWPKVNSRAGQEISLVPTETLDKQNAKAFKKMGVAIPTSIPPPMTTA